mmetsp:Transcript_1222/g.2675  ORF Transcript_1222/g.2675 Transcript_1222/m.2675 type:complete len:123 (+) Transcript_1222:101-469(+)
MIDRQCRCRSSVFGFLLGGKGENNELPLGSSSTTEQCSAALHEVCLMRIFTHVSIVRSCRVNTFLFSLHGSQQLSKIDFFNAGLAAFSSRYTLQNAEARPGLSTLPCPFPSTATETPSEQSN